MINHASLKLKTSALQKLVSRGLEISTDLEKIFVKASSDKRLLSKVYKELLNLNNKKQTNWFN